MGYRSRIWDIDIDMGYGDRYGIWNIDMVIYHIDMVILDVDIGHGILIRGMTVSILSSLISMWDILSLQPRQECTLHYQANPRLSC